MQDPEKLRHVKNSGSQHCVVSELMAGGSTKALPTVAIFQEASIFLVLLTSASILVLGSHSLSSCSSDSVDHPEYKQAMARR